MIKNIFISTSVSREKNMIISAVKRARGMLVMALCAFVIVSCSRSDEAAQAAIELDIQAIESALAALEDNDEGYEYSVWLGGSDNQAWYSHNAKAIMPAASAIKTAILIEFFSDKIETLDVPFAELAAILDNPDSQAIAHFTPEKQEAARAELKGLTARQLAEAMIHKQHVQSNAAYNAAANVIMEYFGGPQALTERIHRRYPQAQELTLARYMLADRQKNDDNLLNAFSLAMVLGELANTTQPDMLRSEIRTVLWLEKDDIRGDHYYKGGSLSSMPQVRIEAGWWEKNCRASVYVVIAHNPITASSKPDYDEVRTNLKHLSDIVQNSGIHMRDTLHARHSATHSSPHSATYCGIDKNVNK